MAGRSQNEPTTSSQLILTREVFEREVVRGDRPPHYLDTGRHENEFKVRHKTFNLPYNAGSCRVSWENDQWNFEWS
jgi:hypothetical protein